MSVDPLIQTFFEEAGELLADYEAGLLTLEARPGDAELLNRIFRSAHTLKGSSAMLGLDEIAVLTHALEDLLDQLRAGWRRVTPALVDTLLGAGDVLRRLVDRVPAGPGPMPAEERRAVDDAVRALHAAGSGAQGVAPRAPAARTPASSASAGRALYHILFRPPADLLRRDADLVRFVRGLAELGELLQVQPEPESLPRLGEGEAVPPDLAITIWLLSTQPSSALAERFEFVADPDAVTIESLSMEPGAPSTEPEAEGAARARETAGLPPEDAPRAASPDAASIRIPVDKVDRVVNLVGELVITQSIVTQTLANWSPDQLPRLAEIVGQMDRHARELHERLLGVRMIPVATLFGRFARLVRDLAAAGGKQAALETAGEDTEFDKTVIEKIADPLAHLVRNAVDHGLEGPEARQRAGKPERGVVRLRASQEGGSIYVEVGDDGRGLDREKIIARAVALGLVPADRPLSDEDAFALIFHPGLSTAPEVTRVSGRGVGMDVVKRNVEALGGSVSIRSAPGVGTRFLIKLPLTLAIMDGQRLRVGDQVYILPLSAIVESIRPAPSNVHRVFDQGEMVTARGQALPVIRLHELLGIEPRARDLADALLVIVEHGGGLAALVADDVLGQQQVVVKSLERAFQRIDGVAGATILGDGRVALILDVPGLLALARARRGASARGGVAGAGPRRTDRTDLLQERRSA